MTEPACPFCRSPLDLAGVAAPLPPAARLTRAALYALGAGTLSLASACGGTATTGSLPRDSGTETDASEAGGFDANCCPPYGLPPIPPDGGGVLYGAPPEDSGSGIAPYGLPPVPPED